MGKTDVKKRKEIANSIFDELEAKFPNVSEKGVAYEQSLSYITLEIQDLDCPQFSEILFNDIRDFILYILIRKRMCSKGWYMEYSELEMTSLGRTLQLYRINGVDLNDSVGRLVKLGLLHIIKKDEVLYLTSAQQIYNWEMLQNKRKNEREIKARSRKKRGIGGSEEKEVLEVKIVKDEPSEDSVLPYKDDNIELDESQFY